MGVTYGKYCGLRSGKTVLVTGSRASFHFHSDSSVQKKGFRLYLSIVSSGKSLLNLPPVKTNGFQMTHGFPAIASVPTRNIIARALKDTKWDLERTHNQSWQTSHQAGILNFASSQLSMLLTSGRV